MSDMPDAERSLRRKAEREQRARQEAEAIAERATLELYQASERQRAILMSVGDAILATDAEGRIDLANRAASKLLGKPESLLAGRSLHEAIHPSTPTRSCPQDPCPLEVAVRANEPVVDAETVAIGMGGRSFPAGYTFTPIIQSERVAGSVLSLRDIRLRKQAEEARVKVLAQMDELKRLQELDQFKTNFINMAAHELRTPLTPIRTELYLLRQGVQDLPDDQRRSVEILHRNFERLGRLVEEVLEAARMQAGKLGVNRTTMDLVAVVRETVESFRSTLAEKGIRLETQLAPAMPIHGDASRLAQVMTNLLSNAAKFTPEGGIVTVTARAGEDLATVAVRDTGPGLSPAETSLLFKPFSQVSGHHQAGHDGAGLGLYICRTIVELHGGKIWVDSPGKGHGAAFSFAVPLANATTPTTAEKPTPVPHVGGGAHA